MPRKKPARPAPALRITLPGGSCVVGSQASLAKILELTLFRPAQSHAAARAPVTGSGISRSRRAA